MSTNRNQLSEQIKEYKKEIRHYDKILNSYKQENVPCRKIGTVFLTFPYQKIVNEILKKYESSFLNSFLRNLVVSIRRPLLSYNNRTVVVYRAPAPREVIWKNLSFSFFKSIVAELLFISTMVLLIYLAFKIQFIVVGYAYELRV